MGLLVNGGKTLNGIPGLELYLDSRYGKEYVGGEVRSWRDLSNNGYLFYAPNAAARMIEVGNFLTEGSLVLLNTTKPFDFLTTSYKYGIYTIAGIDVIANVSPFSNYSDNGIVSHRFASNFQINTRYYESDVITYNYNTAAFTLQSIDSYGSYRNSLSDTGNLKTYKNGVLVNTINATFANTIVSDRTNIAIGGDGTTNMRTGVIIIYNWTDYSAAQIDSFNAQVLPLVEQIRTALGGWV